MKRFWRRLSSEPVEVISIPKIVKGEHSLQQNVPVSPEKSKAPDSETKNA